MMNIVAKTLNSSRENSTAHLKNEVGDFPGGLVVKNHPPLQGMWV